jgi:Secretion system C-terminal sorting domain
MKRLSIIFLFSIYNSISYSQLADVYFDEFTVSQINTNEININLKVNTLVVAGYINNNYTIDGNTINLNCCYWITDFGGTLNLENNIAVIVPNQNINYVLNINLYTSFDQTTCFESLLKDAATINVQLPLNNPVTYLKKDLFKKEDKEKIVVFPNPFQESFSISNTVGKVQDFEFKIIDIMTRTVEFGKVYNDKKINAEALKTGTYILEIRDKKGNLSLKKVVKN